MQGAKIAVNNGRSDINQQTVKGLTTGKIFFVQVSLTRTVIFVKFQVVVKKLSIRQLVVKIAVRSLFAAQWLVGFHAEYGGMVGI
jgi:hypothetical protein